MFEKIVEFIRENYPHMDKIPLHIPRFRGNEKTYLEECIDTTMVSSVGAYVDQFEEKLKELTGAKSAVAVVNGTSALHISLLLAGVEKEDLVITQPFTFIATCNAITYTGAMPVFIDIEKSTLGIDPNKLELFLSEETNINDQGDCIHTSSGKRIRACLPMHTFGFPSNLDRLLKICSHHNIQLVEDAAESIGSYYQGKHTGRHGLMGAFSFNGNKTITTVAEVP